MPNWMVPAFFILLNSKIQWGVLFGGEALIELAHSISPAPGAI
jgi:hypothetical protein